MINRQPADQNFMFPEIILFQNQLEQVDERHAFTPN